MATLPWNDAMKELNPLAQLWSRRRRNASAGAVPGRPAGIWRELASRRMRLRENQFDKILQV
jgi:hypothetical protein